MSGASRSAGFLPPPAWSAAWIVISLAYFGWVYVASSGESCCWESGPQILGAILTLSLGTGYVTFFVGYLGRRTRESVAQLGPVADPAELAAALEPPSLLAVLVTVGVAALFAISQFLEVLLQTPEFDNAWLDFSMMGGNVAIWMSMGWLMAVRFTNGFRMRALGRRVRVDLYDPAALRPFGDMAVREVLVVMGGLSLSTLQSLDAEFRWYNYQWVLMVVLPSAAVLFTLPLWGVHQAIHRARSERLGWLQQLINAADQGDITRLDTLVAHRDRVHALSSWPLDLGLVARVAFYLVIPPLAWVGAALVELFVDRLVG